MKSKSPDIRVLTPADAAAYQALRLQGLREEPTAFASDFEEEFARPISCVAERIAPRSDKATFGAFLGEELAGVVGILREPKPRLAHKALLWGMYVTPSARQQGVGRLLVATALSFAWNELGVCRVNLGVNARNRAAIALYERMGFKPFGVERDFMRVDGVAQDEVHMVCEYGGAGTDPSTGEGPPS